MTVSKEEFVQKILDNQRISGSRSAGTLIYVRELSEWLADFAQNQNTPVPEGTGRTPLAYMRYIGNNLISELRADSDEGPQVLKNTADRMVADILGVFKDTYNPDIAKALSKKIDLGSGKGGRSFSVQ